MRPPVGGGSAVVRPAVVAGRLEETRVSFRQDRLAGGFVVLAAAAAVLELVAGRTLGYVQHVRQRLGLPVDHLPAFRWRPYVVVFAVLCCLAALGVLVARIAGSRFSPAGRALAVGVGAAVGFMGAAAVFVPPGVRGILTLHLAVALGGIALAAVLAVSPVPAPLRLAALLPALLPSHGVAAVLIRSPASSAALVRATFWVLLGLVTIGMAVASWMHYRRWRPLRLAWALASASAVGCASAAAAALEPHRAAEFLLFSHGLLADFRGALAVGSLLVLAAALAAAPFLWAPSAPGEGERRARPLMGMGIALCVLAGPAPLSVPQSLILAVGQFALLAGALEPETLVEDPPEVSFAGDTDGEAGVGGDAGAAEDGAG